MQRTAALYSGHPPAHPCPIPTPAHMSETQRSPELNLDVDIRRHAIGICPLPVRRNFEIARILLGQGTGARPHSSADCSGGVCGIRAALLDRGGCPPILRELHPTSGPSHRGTHPGQRRLGRSRDPPPRRRTSHPRRPPQHQHETRRCDEHGIARHRRRGAVHCVGRFRCRCSPPR